MKLRNKKTGEIVELDHFSMHYNRPEEWGQQPCSTWNRSLAELNEEWEDYKPTEPLIKDEKIRKAVRAWAEAENCTSEMNLYYTLNRQEKYITFHNPQTGSELQLCEFDSPVFQEMREYTIAELCGEGEE